MQLQQQAVDGGLTGTSPELLALVGPLQTAMEADVVTAASLVQLACVQVCRGVAHHTLPAASARWHSAVWRRRLQTFRQHPVRTPEPPPRHTLSG